MSWESLSKKDGETKERRTELIQIWKIFKILSFWGPIWLFQETVNIPTRELIQNPDSTSGKGKSMLSAFTCFGNKEESGIFQRTFVR